MKELLTASRMQALVTCPRKHYWRYELGFQSAKQSDALVFGSAWHSAMEARWQGEDFDAALATAVGDTEFEEIQIATLAGLLKGYYDHYADNECVKELHPEVEFNLPISSSRTFESAGKIDGLGILHDGRLAMVEHKTCGESIDSGSDYWLRLQFNQQVMQYVHASRELDWDIEFILYDVTRKPSIRQKKEETCLEFRNRLHEDTKARPEFYFARREVPILDCDLDEFLVQRYELSKMILALRQAEKRTALREHAWPRNVNMMTCRMCDFSGFCLQNIHADENNVPSGIELGRLHGELQQGGGE
jgi:hypothetical protein